MRRWCRRLYTGGAYTTGDLDFVGDIPDAVARVLLETGFRREGRHWVLEEGQVFIEMPGSSLEPDDPPVRLEIGGRSVIAASPESMLVDRLASWQFWRSSVDGVNAYLLWSSQQERMDRKRIAALSRKLEIGKALAKLEGFVARLGGKAPSPEDLEKWAESFP